MRMDCINDKMHSVHHSPLAVLCDSKLVSVACYLQSCVTNRIIHVCHEKSTIFNMYGLAEQCCQYVE